MTMNNKVKATKQTRALTLLSRVPAGNIAQTPARHHTCPACPVACFCSRRQAEPRRSSRKRGEAMMGHSAAAAAADDDDDDEVFRT